jgi:hypothetical protein
VFRYPRRLTARRPIGVELPFLEIGSGHRAAFVIGRRDFRNRRSKEDRNDRQDARNDRTQPEPGHDHDNTNPYQQID